MASCLRSLCTGCWLWTLLHIVVQTQGACVVTFNNQVLKFEACKPLNGDGSYMLSWNYTGTRRLTAVLQERHQGWLGFGFSPEGGMVGSNTMMAVRDQESSKGATPYCCYLAGRESFTLAESPCRSPLVVEEKDAWFNGTHLSLYFMLEVDPAAQTGGAVTKIIYGKGDSSGTYIEQHDSNNVFRINLDFTDLKNQNVRHLSIDSDHMKQSHSILQVISFGILLPMGPLLPRYFKNSEPYWYYLHVSIQTVAFILGTAGFSTGLVLRSRNQTTHMAHYSIGILVFILACMQMLALLIRPKKDAKIRPWWNMYHQVCGRLTILFGIVNIFIGFSLLQPPAAYTIAYSLFFVCLLLSIGLLEFCMPRKEGDGSGAGITVTMGELGRSLSSQRGKMTESSSGRFERLQVPEG